MSRTNKTDKPKNPASKFLEWKSQAQAWEYYDKANEKSVHVTPSDLKFIVLDQLNTVKGFDERAGSGIWSNEVRSVAREPLTVKNKNGTIVEGLWRDIKGRNGSRFTKSVYVMGKIGDGEYELMNLQLNGAALSSWFEFCETTGDVETDIVICAEGTKEGRKGAVTYFMPDFRVVSRTLSEAAADKANEMDATLQAYLREYFGKSQGEPGQAGRQSEPDADAPEPEPEDIGEDTPF